ncbi:MAG: Para-aminobenzoate synthase, subunit [Verrucomicrobiales bacterium]|nr:Para-aminobenzoate synthase, subunit [Verrucomicrobiales bacterium]
MNTIIEDLGIFVRPEIVCDQLADEKVVVLLHSSRYEPSRARYSYLLAQPLMVMASSGSSIQTFVGDKVEEHYGNPWSVMEELLRRFEMLRSIDYPFPLGGAFGYWGYDLGKFCEPIVARAGVPSEGAPDALIGFFDSYILFDHHLSKILIISTGLDFDGSISDSRAKSRATALKHLVLSCVKKEEQPASSVAMPGSLQFGMSQHQYIAAVKKAQDYIRTGDIYQVNLAHELHAEWNSSGWDFYKSLVRLSPAPFSAYLRFPQIEIASSSPELFMKISGDEIETRPIKGTRPRGTSPDHDSQLGYELISSEKERSELVMITDLLRNDLGRICQYGTVHVPDLMTLEKYAQVQHLVSTVKGSLLPEVSHLQAVQRSFPGGSITGAPKLRAMQIIEELETASRGPYTGCCGYFGFNRETQLSILIRTGILRDGKVNFPVGAGIVSDSVPASEWTETLDKAGAFRGLLRNSDDSVDNMNLSSSGFIRSSGLAQ